jgi:hypothetical protein
VLRARKCAIRMVPHLGTLRALYPSMTMSKLTVTHLRTSYVDSFGNVEELEGENIKEIAEQLPEDYTGDLIVVDEAGFTRGYVHSRNDWRAA